MPRTKNSSKRSTRVQSQSAPDNSAIADVNESAPSLSTASQEHGMGVQNRIVTSLTSDAVELSPATTSLSRGGNRASVDVNPTKPRRSYRQRKEARDAVMQALVDSPSILNDVASLTGKSEIASVTCIPEIRNEMKQDETTYNFPISGVAISDEYDKWADVTVPIYDYPAEPKGKYIAKQQRKASKPQLSDKDEVPYFSCHTLMDARSVGPFFGKFSDPTLRDCLISAINFSETEFKRTYTTSGYAKFFEKYSSFCVNLPGPYFVKNFCTVYICTNGRTGICDIPCSRGSLDFYKGRLIILQDPDPLYIIRHPKTIAEKHYMGLFSYCLTAVSELRSYGFVRAPVPIEIDCAYVKKDLLVLAKYNLFSKKFSYFGELCLLNEYIYCRGGVPPFSTPLPSKTYTFQSPGVADLHHSVQEAAYRTHISTLFHNGGKLYTVDATSHFMSDSFRTLTLKEKLQYLSQYVLHCSPSNLRDAFGYGVRLIRNYICTPSLSYKTVVDIDGNLGPVGLRTFKNLLSKLEVPTKFYSHNHICAIIRTSFCTEADSKRFLRQATKHYSVLVSYSGLSYDISIYRKRQLKPVSNIQVKASSGSIAQLFGYYYLITTYLPGNPPPHQKSVPDDMRAVSFKGAKSSIRMIKTDDSLYVLPVKQWEHGNRKVT